jgi:hypothetical protein
MRGRSHHFHIAGRGFLAGNFVAEHATRFWVTREDRMKLVWIVDPTFRTVTVYRRDAEPKLFNATEALSAEPHLPGFKVAVADVSRDNPASRSNPASSS